MSVEKQLLPEAFLAKELPYKDIRAYLAPFLDELDHFVLHKTFYPISDQVDIHSEEVVNRCAKNGNVKMIKWLFYTGYGYISWKTFDMAKEHECVQTWIRETCPNVLQPLYPMHWRLTHSSIKRQRQDALLHVTYPPKEFIMGLMTGRILKKTKL